MTRKLDVSTLDIDESGLNDLLADIWEKAEEQPEVIIMRRSQIGVAIPLEMYFMTEEDVRALAVAKDIGITPAQARKLIARYQVKRFVKRVKDIQNPTHYESDFGVHKLEIIE
jgi:hypothetical protein